MRRSNFRTMLVWGVLGAALVSFAATGWASIQPRGPRGFRGHRGGPGALLRELDLSEEQRQQIRSLMESEGGGDARELVREKRRALNEAVESGADEGTIRQLAYEVGMAEGDAAVARAHVHRQVMAILTEEQRQELETLKEERKQEMAERRERFKERMERRRERHR